eukprot:gene11475-biopygen12414
MTKEPRTSHWNLTQVCILGVQRKLSAPRQLWSEVDGGWWVGSQDSGQAYSNLIGAGGRSTPRGLRFSCVGGGS